MTMWFKKIGLGAVILALCACDEARPVPNPNDNYDQVNYRLGSPLTIESNQRFSIKRVSVFRDDLAYKGNRGIYVVVDTQTGKEYVGISGIGISELMTGQIRKQTQTIEH